MITFQFVKAKFLSNKSLAWLSLKYLVTFALLQLWLSVSVWSAHATAPPLLLSKNSSYDLAGHFEVLVDTGGKLGLSDILSPHIASRFKPLSGNLNRGYTPEATWLRFSFVREAGFPPGSYLWLEPPYIDDISVYFQTGASPLDPASYKLQKLGDHFPVVQRPLKHSEMVALLPDNRQCQVYIRVHTFSSHNLKGRIITAESFLSENSNIIIFQGAYLALTLIFCLINLIIAVRLRDHVYSCYGGYLLTLFLTELGRDGLLAVLQPDLAHRISDLCSGLGVGFGFSIFTLFFMLMFDTRTLYPRIHKYFCAIIILGAAAPLTTGTSWYGTCITILFFNSLALFTIQFVIAVKLKRQKVPIAGLFLLAFVPMFVGAYITMLRVVGVLPLNWLTYYTYQFSSSIHMVLMMLVLSERVLIAERKATAMARESEQKAIELAGEMTHELQKSKNKLEVSLASELLARERQHRFITMLSHEYRTPLAIIRGNLDIMELKEIDGHGEHETELKKMKRAVKRLVEVMEVSLEANRLSDPQERNELQPVRLSAFMASLLDDTRTLWAERSFVYSEDASSHIIQGEPEHLKTALVNLLDNALKYSPPDTPIIIECKAEAGKVIIRIFNYGSGITLAEEEQLFEKYRRGRSSNTTGAGIGLWLVRQIVEQHHGHVTLTGTASGVMATVSLPLLDSFFQQ